MISRFWDYDSPSSYLEPWPPHPLSEPWPLPLSVLTFNLLNFVPWYPDTWHLTSLHSTFDPSIDTWHLTSWHSTFDLSTHDFLTIVEHNVTFWLPNVNHLPLERLTFSSLLYILPHSLVNWRLLTTPNYPMKQTPFSIGAASWYTLEESMVPTSISRSITESFDGIELEAYWFQ